LDASPSWEGWRDGGKEGKGDEIRVSTLCAGEGDCGVTMLWRENPALELTEHGFVGSFAELREREGAREGAREGRGVSQSWGKFMTGRQRDISPRHILLNSSIVIPKTHLEFRLPADEHRAFPTRVRRLL
jgi:hypothetical protein